MFGGGIEHQKKQVNFEELLELSTLHVSRGNYDRALLFLEDAKSRLLRQDERRKILEDRIREIKMKQVGTEVRHGMSD